jgi:hypothetical protein
MVDLAAEQGELRYEVWAERLEREFSLLLIPFMDPKLTTEKIRIISARMAMLAAKRARQASALDDDDERVVKCASCQTKLIQTVSASLCCGCLRRFKLISDDDPRVRDLADEKS